MKCLFVETKRSSGSTDGIGWITVLTEETDGKYSGIENCGLSIWGFWGKAAINYNLFLAQQNESQVEQSIELVHHGAGNEHRDFNMNREIRKLLNQD
jgi:hypothetical protein